MSKEARKPKLKYPGDPDFVPLNHHLEIDYPALEEENLRSRPAVLPETCPECGTEVDVTRGSSSECPACGTVVDSFGKSGNVDIEKVIKIAILEALAEDDEDDSNVEYMWVSTPNCCEECQAMDGERRDVDGEYEDGKVPGEMHPHCKCSEIMVTKH